MMRSVCSPIAKHAPELMQSGGAGKRSTCAFETRSLVCEIERGVAFEVDLPAIEGRKPAISMIRLFQDRRECSGEAEPSTETPVVRAECREGSGPEESDGSGQDKRCSPVERQAIDMARVQPCRSVGGSAAIAVFPHEFNDRFGTGLVIRPERPAP